MFLSSAVILAALSGIFLGVASHDLKQAKYVHMRHKKYTTSKFTFRGIDVIRIQTQIKHQITKEPSKKF